MWSFFRAPGNGNLPCVGTSVPTVSPYLLAVKLDSQHYVSGLWLLLHLL
jgi:hypothetical protein